MPTSGTFKKKPTACPLRGDGCAGTQKDRLGEAVLLSTGTPHTRAMDMPLELKKKVKIDKPMPTSI